MDAHLWGNRQQSEHQPSAGHTKLQQLDQQQSHAAALALLASEPNSSLSKGTPLFPLQNVGYFTLAQWQELELQALIYKYMLAGASVPMELILPIKRSLLGASPYFHYPEFYHHLQPSLLQTGFWGKCAMDPEPGRCRRTDGKKWRCSREVVAGQKYCERHVHRGRNRSRKHVEAPTPSSKSSSKSGLCSPSLNTQSLDQRQSNMKTVEKNLQSDCLNFYLKDLRDDKAEGYVLQSFLDEWPKSQRENTDSINYTHLSISAPGNQSSDFSLKLSTGNPEKPGGQDDKNGQPRNKGSGWVSYGQASMGGPLAEALRSSASTHSPTSVLHNSNGSISEISSISP
ncbi:growth-regulating factor 3-like [Curcuma longa]|uniref:growth-regulating factor 3-like n=1 Tax=Curcuma longa TaxID=136217 RepID=UPI003D9F216B